MRNEASKNAGLFLGDVPIVMAGSVPGMTINYPRNIVPAVSSPLASAASTVPMSRPR